jgi:D-alanyl-D-alanine carboxypeptidase
MKGNPMQRRTVLKGLSGAALAGTGVLAGPAAAASGGGHDDDRRDELTALLAAEHAAGMPGMNAEVRESDQRYGLAAGVADLTTGRPARPGAYHRIGGATKSFVAVAVLQLVGERRIDLDAPIGRYLPDIVPDERGRQITVRMLLNHTSGLADFVWIRLAAEGEPVPDGVLFASLASIADTATRRFRPRELAALGLGLPPVAAPGTLWSYSNANYVLLGLLLERVTRRAYEDVLTRRVLRPLGLRHSFLPRRRRRLADPHLEAYVPWSDGALRAFTTYDMSWAWGSTDVISTVGDLNRFYRDLLGGRVLPPALLGEMKTTVPMAAQFPQFAGYGLGLFWLASQCGRTWGHDGFVVGHNTFCGATEDGTTAQFSIVENLNFYPGMSGMLPTHPIDVARAQLITGATSACVTGAAVADVPAGLVRSPWWLHRISALAPAA